jgi:glycerophosphoryl diester phosphodiesterase
MFVKKPLLFVLTLLSSCTITHSLNNSTIKTSFDKQGHRGCRGLMPENTIPAMLHAIDLGVTTLEMDVVISKDNQVVVSHDAWMNPEFVTKPDGTFITGKEDRKYLLYQMNYEEIKQYDVGLKQHSKFPDQKKIAVAKPLLSELIDSVKSHLQAGTTINYNIETKSTAKGDNIHHPSPEIFVDLLMQVLSDKNVLSTVTIQSFDFRTLKYLHNKYPEVKTSALIDAADMAGLQQHLDQLGFTPNIYSPHFSLVSKKLISNCHQKGILVIPWTVNNVSKMKALKNSGVDGIITDYPNLFNELDK